MKYNIIGYDLSLRYAEELSKYSSIYQYTFSNVHNYQQLQLALKQFDNKEVFIAMDIDENAKEKYNITTKLKSHRNVNVVFISREIDADERMRWLNFGAMFYIKKPFNIQELVLRSIELTNFKTINMLVDVNFTVDLHKNTIMYKGQKIKTTPSIYHLIVFFIDNEGQVVTREEIMRDVLNTNDFLTSRNVDTLIKEMRKLTSPDIVSTVRSVGYCYSTKKPTKSSF